MKVDVNIESAEAVAARRRILDLISAWGTPAFGFELEQVMNEVVAPPIPVAVPVRKMTSLVMAAVLIGVALSDGYTADGQEADQLELAYRIEMEVETYVGRLADEARHAGE